MTKVYYAVPKTESKEMESLSWHEKVPKWTENEQPWMNEVEQN